MAAGVMLAACSQQPVTPQPRATLGAATPAPLSTPAAATTDDHAVPRPGEQKTFRDWTVACDNGRRCAMASLGTDADFPRMTMQVARAAGPAGAIDIALAAPQDDAPPPTVIVIDRRRFAVDGDGLSGTRAIALAKALVEARTIEIRDASGTRIATVSPAGASAALRYIDAQQGRADSVTALVARGDRPATSVPAAPPLPRVRSVAFEGTPATLTPALVATMTRIGKCEAPLPGQAPQAQALADGTTLVLLPCSSGAYNEIDALFVVRDGKAVPAQTDAPSGFEETGADSRTPVHSVINGGFDGGMLTSYAKGRGLGDCGVRQGFVWDGTRLRLVEQQSMGECRGNPDYLPVWRATVVRE